MPRDLSEVLHYFLPEIDRAGGDASERRETPSPSTRPAARNSTDGRPKVSVLSIPCGDRDVVRAALAWSLTVETARLGVRAIMLTPESDQGSALWPVAGHGPFGSELIRSPAENLETLDHVSSRLAAENPTRDDRPAIIFVRIPPSWLERASTAPTRSEWLLLLHAAHAIGVGPVLGGPARILASQPRAALNLIVYGAATLAEAKKSQEAFTARSEGTLGRAPRTCGLLVEDLHLYRAIAAQRAVGLAYPRAPLTRALQQVARNLVDEVDARPNT